MAEQGTVRTSVEEIIHLLHLQPHPAEGGWFVETYRSKETLTRYALSGRYGAARSLGTAIYYLLTKDSFSALHRLKSDEVFHFYLGDPVRMVQLFPEGHGQFVSLGPDIAAGQSPQVVVPRGTWQGLSLREGGEYALLGTTVAPGFDFADFELGKREELLAAYPAFQVSIEALTRG